MLHSHRQSSALAWIGSVLLYQAPIKTCPKHSNISNPINNDPMTQKKPNQY